MNYTQTFYKHSDPAAMWAEPDLSSYADRAAIAGYLRGLADALQKGDVLHCQTRMVYKNDSFQSEDLLYTHVLPYHLGITTYAVEISLKPEAVMHVVFEPEVPEALF